MNSPKAHSIAKTEMDVKNFREEGLYVQKLKKLFVLWLESVVGTNQRGCCNFDWFTLDFPQLLQSVLKFTSIQMWVLGLCQNFLERVNNLSEGFNYVVRPWEKFIGFSLLEMEQRGSGITVNHWSSTKQDLWGSLSTLGQANFIISCAVWLFSLLSKKCSLICFNSLSLIVSCLYSDFYGIGHTVFNNIL